MLAAAALLFLQEDAEAVFRKFEALYREAKAVSVNVRFTLQEVGQDAPAASAKGRIRFKPGDKCAVKMSVKEKGDHEVDYTSDGTSALKKSDGRTTLDNARPGMTRFVAASLTRGGFGVMLILEKKGPAPPDPDEELKASDFALASDGDDRVLSYTVAAKGVGDLRVRLWLTSALVPKKRVVNLRKGDKEAVITEVYEEVSTADIPDREFEVKSP